MDKNLKRENEQEMKAAEQTEIGALTTRTNTHTYIHTQMHSYKPMR